MSTIQSALKLSSSKKTNFFIYVYGRLALAASLCKLSLRTGGDKAGGTWK
jgi:hypothetical protein